MFGSLYHNPGNKDNRSIVLTGGPATEKKRDCSQSYATINQFGH